MLLHPALDLDPPVYRPIPVRADPCGLAYDGPAGVLYVGDGNTGAILRIEGERQRRLATIPSGGPIATQQVGDIALAPDGTVYATRLGQGQAGTIFRIEPTGRIEELDRLSPAWWRLGVTYDAREHTVYATQFLTSQRGAHEGSIVAIDLVTREPSTILDGFLKPVGIAKLGPTLVVADARQRAVFRVELVAGRAVLRLQLVADIGRPDAVCACGLDSVLVTSYDEETQRGAVRRLWLDGRTRGIASGSWEPRGVATDGTRVFVSARRAGKILVFPL